MHTGQRVIHNTYRDSVSLMQLSARVAVLPGVDQASIVMATEGNLALLRDAGLLAAPLAAAPGDLLAVVRAASPEAVEAALAEAEHGLTAPASPGARRAARAAAPRSLQAALAELPEATLALVSTPGEYAAAEALKALRLGLHVMLFSDNVSVADELGLKHEARARGLLVMGPDCGTAIVGGVPLGFANAVRPGPIGVIGASGTGMQQVTSLADRAGVGISHALGTGGRDLRAEIGGATMLAALDELAADAATRVIVLVSKPPAPAVAARVLARAREAGKPVVACFLGADPANVGGPGVAAAATLEEAAAMAIACARGEAAVRVSAALPAFQDLGLRPGQRYVRGLYSGGTFCYEATLLLSAQLEGVRSNTPVGRAQELDDPWHPAGHALIDLGDDEFTRGRPHPMIDHRLRNERIVRDAEDPEVAVLLLDVVLGYGAHPDPAREIVPALRAARAAAERAGRRLALVGFVCGTEGDPQGLARQESALREAGMVLTGNCTQAARLAAAMVSAHGAPART